MEQDRAPKISVIVPAFNAELFLRRCIDSILQQEYSNIEIIIIDDGSTDRTADIVNEYADKDKRVIGLHQNNRGLVAVRNRGIELASGDYIGFVDSDDSISADLYRRLLENAIENNADISICGIRFSFDVGEPIDHWGTGEKTVFCRKEAIEELLIGSKIEPSLCNKLYRREIVSNSCLSTEILNNEDLLRNYVVFSRAKKIVFEDFIGYVYHRRDNSMSNNASLLNIVSDILAAQGLLARVGEKEDERVIKRSNVIHAISIINRICKDESKEADQLRNKCRIILRENKHVLMTIPTIQRVEAQLFLLSAKVHKKVYLSIKKFDKRRI